MRKIGVLLAAFVFFTQTGMAHAGLYHSYKGWMVGVLLITLWTTLALYEKFGDTFLGHWILFSGFFLSFFVPVFYPHEVITARGLVYLGFGISVLAPVVFLLRRFISKKG